MQPGKQNKQKNKKHCIVVDDIWKTNRKQEYSSIAIGQLGMM